MSNYNKTEELINELWSDFIQARTHFPFLSAGHIGLKTFESPDYYNYFNNKLVFKFEKPIDQSIVYQNNKVANWINQNVLIRLAAILDEENIIKKTTDIDKTIEGSKEIEILLRLRNKFAHSRGKYNAAKKENRLLLNDIVDTFKLQHNEYLDYPLSIDTVIRPIFNATIKYLNSEQKTLR